MTWYTMARDQHGGPSRRYIVHNLTPITGENLLEGGRSYCLKLPPGSTVVGEKNYTQEL